MFVKFLTSAIALSSVFLYGSTGEIIVEKGGHLNLGIPGIMSVSAAVSALVEYALIKGMGTSAPALLVIIPIIVAFLVGGLMGLLYSFLTVTLRCNQNVVGLAMTTLGVGLAGYYMTGAGSKIMIVARASKYFATLFDVSGGGAFAKIFFSHGIMVYLAIIIAVIAQIVLSKTRTGLNLRAVGENPATADAAGINVSKYKYVSTVIGCGISGLGGLTCVMDYMGGNWEYVLEGFGWLSIALVIFTLWKPALSILGSIIFAGLYIASFYVEGISFAQIELIKLLPYVVTVLVLIITSMINKRETQAPAALGQSYYREDR